MQSQYTDRNLNWRMAPPRPTPGAEAGNRSGWLQTETPFPARVRGVDAKGQAFRAQTVLSSLSADSLCLELAEVVKQGAKLFVVARLSTAAAEMPAPHLAVLGEVLRVEPGDAGDCRIVVAFRHHRFLYTAKSPP